MKVDDLTEFWLGTQEKNPELKVFYICTCIGTCTCFTLILSSSSPTKFTLLGAPQLCLAICALVLVSLSFHNVSRLSRAHPPGWAHEWPDPWANEHGQHRLGGDAHEDHTLLRFYQDR